MMSLVFLDKARASLAVAQYCFDTGVAAMINFKQQQLIEEYLNAITERFPEVRFISVSESPEDPADLWLNVTTPLMKIAK
jgi:hypothetical protein